MKKSWIAAICALAAVIPFSVNIDSQKKNLKMTALLYQLKAEGSDHLTLRFPGVSLTTELGLPRRKNKEEMPVFYRALHYVAGRKTVDADELCHHLKVGRSCGDAFLETMEEMNIVRPEGEGRYSVIMKRKKILGNVGESEAG